MNFFLKNESESSVSIAADWPRKPNLTLQIAPVSGESGATGLMRHRAGVWTFSGLPSGGNHSFYNEGQLGQSGRHRLTM
ncbi:MAG: hypothetical protein R3E42_00880 [Burkholderiaceae bacterium]